MKLYYSPGACSLAPHIVLHETGQKFDLVKVDLAAKKTDKGDDYFKVNPLGYVPALQLDSGEVLTEAQVLAQYIADQAPTAKLAPNHGTPERARLQQWLNFIATELHKGFSPLWKANTPEAYKSIVKENLATRFDHVNKRLAGSSHLAGPDYSIADAY